MVIQDQQKRLGERLDGLVDDSECGEASFLRGELETLDMEYTRLVLERAEAANKEVQIRTLLELVDAMRSGNWYRLLLQNYYNDMNAEML